MKTEALEAVRKPPYGELQKTWSHTCPHGLRCGVDIASVTFLLGWKLIILKSFRLASGWEKVPGLSTLAPGRGSLVLPERNQGKKLCVFKILLYVYKALGNRAKL